MSELDTTREAVAELGFVVIETTMPAFERLGRSLGTAVSVRPRGPTTDRLTPTSMSEAALRSLSAIYGLDAFPFHTDAAHHRVPPRYLILRLADGASSGTPTLVVDARPDMFDSDELKTLSRESWLVKGGLGRTFYAPILDPSRMLLRFDAACMVQPSGTRLLGQEILQQRLKESPIAEINWGARTTLVADNWRVFHSRPAVNQVETPRVLLRTLLA